MTKTAVLFDLDGTLLPMDQEKFTKAYFSGLAAKLAPYGYQPDLLIKAIWTSTKGMIMNQTEQTNEQVFWQSFSSILGDHVMNDLELFRSFYLNEFKDVRTSCGYTPLAAEAVRTAKEKGMRVVLATNPIFPHEATEERIRWAGLNQEDFEYITVYENSTSTKPNPRYYTELLGKLSLDPAECLMVGNDADEDGAALKAGMDLFLVTDDLINKSNRDLSTIRHGSMSELIEYLRTI